MVGYLNIINVRQNSIDSEHLLIKLHHFS